MEVEFRLEKLLQVPGIVGRYDMYPMMIQIPIGWRVSGDLIGDSDRQWPDSLSLGDIFHSAC